MDVTNLTRRLGPSWKCFMCQIEMSCTVVCWQQQAIGWKKSVCLSIPSVCSYGELTRSLRDVVTTNCFRWKESSDKPTTITSSSFRETLSDFAYSLERLILSLFALWSFPIRYDFARMKSQIYISIYVHFERNDKFEKKQETRVFDE